ncbi:GntR family transcriptional regulator [Lentzea sp. CC55]|uniref:GntR family transcriptional regulator n=1 Tax=Lentzea sp. CC55 TaxID=2884909 RepID=UPI001F453999|nr:GntR family transcriptional regulator [Lentzea sp. CC55]MCG8927399.1 GntR family transcriptional regulator [Lentzea sp. CC55]
MSPSRTGPAGKIGAEQAVSRVVGGIKRMIVSGDLLPGQQIRQEQMAAVLGVSRLPVRKACGSWLPTVWWCTSTTSGSPSRA